MPTISGGVYQRGPCLGFEQITAMTTAKALTPTTGLGPTKAEIQVEVAQVRMRADGTAPTVSVGMLLEAGDIVSFGEGQDLTKVKFINAVASNGAKLNVTYY